MSSTVSHRPPSVASSVDSHRSREDVTDTRAPPQPLERSASSATRHALAQDRNLLRVLNESALDTTDVGAASSTLALSDRVRRRSDVSRIRPTGVPVDRESDPAYDPSAIELPVLTYFGKNDLTITTFREPTATLREDAVATSSSAKGGDPEVVLTYPPSLAPSVRGEDDRASTAPSVSAAQKAVYRRKSLIHFLALCFCVFGMGWNDGTTGPMLPRIQEHYHVRQP